MALSIAPPARAAAGVEVKRSSLSEAVGIPTRARVDGGGAGGGRAAVSLGLWATLQAIVVGRARTRRSLSSVPRAAEGGGEGFVAGFYARAPGKSFKWVYFIRHSEALVNAAGRVFPKDDPRKKAVRMDMKYLDSPLSEKGLSQAQEMRMKAPKVDLVVASPLTRALQTATAIFGCDTPGGPPLVALEALREFCGKQFQPCDSRRAPEELLTVFPHVDFANVPPGADTLLGPGKVETPESADARIARFFAWLREQPPGGLRSDVWNSPCSRTSHAWHISRSSAVSLFI
ncbi:unnamed protein product [Durusdinium trenchii]|uniref:Uncharacterized protein n=1 Tax=Durusdinium trenchii TaxID=1381693 RepID=A0ABP0N030_9DINO